MEHLEYSAFAVQFGLSLAVAFVVEPFQQHTCVMRSLASQGLHRHVDSGTHVSWIVPHHMQLALFEIVEMMGIDLPRGRIAFRESQCDEYSHRPTSRDHDEVFRNVTLAHAAETERDDVSLDDAAKGIALAVVR